MSIELDEFTRAYVECALRSSTDDSDDQGGDPLDENYSIEDIHPATLAMMVLDCRKFQDQNIDLILGKRTAGSKNLEMVCAGQDFWLTRNGHGAGFWDGDWTTGEELTEASKKFGEVDLYVGDDKKIYSWRIINLHDFP